MPAVEVNFLLQVTLKFAGSIFSNAISLYSRYISIVKEFLSVINFTDLVPGLNFTACAATGVDDRVVLFFFVDLEGVFFINEMGLDEMSRVTGETDFFLGIKALDGILRELICLTGIPRVCHEYLIDRLCMASLSLLDIVITLHRTTQQKKWASPFIRKSTRSQTSSNTVAQPQVGGSC